MKKNYSKPEINFDNFRVSTNIAACFDHPDSQTIGVCGYNFHGQKLFTSDVYGCEYVSADGAFGICYYVPTGDTNLFIS